MSVSFVQPIYLWLVLLLVPIWALALLVPSRVARWRRWLSLALRTAMLLLLILALSGLQLVWGARDTATVFVVDHSDSVAPAARAQADEYVQAALSRMPEGDRGGVIVFGGDAIVERALSEEREFIRSTVAPSSDHTDLQHALQLALAVMPNEMRKRIVLLSDGAETRGSALDAADQARAAGVPIDTVSLQAPPAAEDVALITLEAPASAREGQQIRLTIRYETGRATTARLQVLLDRQPVLEQTVALEPDGAPLSVTVPAPGPGFHAWEARLLSPDDTVGANNVQFGFSEVRGAPRVLLIEGTPGRAANLHAALEAAQLNPTTMLANDMPTSLIGLDAYDVIALVDVPYRALPDRAAELLPAYVRELGRGLLMVGGEESYAAGGYLDTPIEDALPVTMRTRGMKVQPDVAIVLVIDRSGSMSGEKLALAKEGAAQAFGTLTDSDQIGVIAFDSAASWAVPLQPKPSADAFLSDLGNIGEGGGTDLRPGLELAADALDQADATIKHIVLLTDGQADRNYDDVIERLKTNGITLSTVGIDDYDPHLEQVAPETGGRFYGVQDVNDVPRLFFDESLRIARRGIVEKEFTPLIAFPAPIVRDLRSVPPLYGYNAVTSKDSAQVVLVSDEDDPILAQWQYGLGRAAAWTPDLKGQWAQDWVRWEGFGRFAAQLVGDLLPSPSAEGFEASTSLAGNALAVELRADALDGRGQTGLGATGRIIGGDGSVQEVPLIEVEPGRYRGTLPLPETGVYRTQVLVRDGNGDVIGTVTTGAVVPPSAEYLQRDGNLALLHTLAERTGGRIELPVERVWDTPATAARRTQPITWPLLILATLVWPIDIAVRRLLLPRPQVVEAWLRSRPRGVRQAAPPRLDRQRARTLARQRRASRTVEPPPSTPSDAPPAMPEPQQFDWRRSRRSVVERPTDRSK